MKKGILRTAITTGLFFAAIATATGQEPGIPSIDEIFAAMDADKDGKLAEAEVQGPLKEKFSAIDANADGFITKEEMVAASKPEKPKAE